MSHLTTGGRRGLAAASLLGLLLASSACGTDTGLTQDIGSVAPGAAVTKGGGETPEGRSDRALEADASRAAQGQLPTPTPAPAGPRLPDAQP